MPYLDGFVAAVPTANKQKFVDHATLGDPVFIEQGATRVVECWGDDVPDGKVTDFRKAVQATEDESVVFSWIEWPDKATRDAGMQKMMDDPRMSPENNPMPFDGKRLIFGGFVPTLVLGDDGAPSSYVDGFILAAPTSGKAAFPSMRPLSTRSSWGTAPAASSKAGVTTCRTASRRISIVRCRRRMAKRWRSRGSNGPTRRPATPACRR